ncbi:MAG: hypothetical protein PWP04_776 [Candidatus Atribacteria bacterium]|nr:hypothetical protein [Candidatus Atribacteria bacterium]
MATASDFHDKGFNCAESTLQGLAEYLGVQNELLPQIATGFGGGVGHTGRICGAISGAVMALGIKYGRRDPQDKKTRDELYQRVEAFLKKVGEKLGHTDCIDLIGVPLNTEEGLKIYRQNHLRDKCHTIIQTVEDLAKEFL